MIDTSYKTPISNLKYDSFEVKRRTVWEQLDMDFWAWLNWFPPISFFQMFIPYCIMQTAVWYNLVDDKGNNFTNFYILSIEKSGAWGLF